MPWPASPERARRHSAPAPERAGEAAPVREAETLADVLDIGMRIFEVAHRKPITHPALQLRVLAAGLAQSALQRARVKPDLRGHAVDAEPEQSRLPRERVFDRGDQAGAPRNPL